MTAATVLCLLLAPGPSMPGENIDANRQERFEATLRAVQSARRDPRQIDAAIRTLTDWINDDIERGQQDLYTVQTYVHRGNLRLHSGRAGEALDDADRALEIWPRDYGACSLRAEALAQLGRTDEAAAARLEADKLLRELVYADDPLLLVETVLTEHLPESPIRSRVVGRLMLACVVCTPLFLLNLWCSRTQWREGRGTWRRRLWVCGVFVLLQIVPLAVTETWGLLRPGEPSDWSFMVTIFVVWNLAYLALALGRPARPAFRKEALPAVEDDALLGRVDELSQRMGVRTPVVRLLKSLTGEQQTLAYAGGIVAPSLVVTDGILHRLAPNERDAVVAHELAHLANHSIWWLVCVTPLTLTAAVLSDPFLPEFTTLALGAALRSGLLRLVSRHFERDCDLRAARVLGFRNMASALSKIHAVHPLRDRGWLSVLIYATTTHPSRDERLAALWRAAPDGDRPEADWDESEERRRRLAARLATLAWAAAIAATVTQGVLRRDTAWPAALLVVWVAGVPCLHLAGLSRHWRRERQRNSAGRRRWPKPLTIALAAMALAVGLVQCSAFNDQRLTAIAAGTLAGIAVLGLFAALGFITVESTPAHVSELRNKLLTALHDGDFPRACRVGSRNLPRMHEYPDFRHNAALAFALDGDSARGLAELRQTALDHPRFIQTLLTQSALLAEEGNYAESLALAEEARSRLQADPEPLLKAAWALWRLGRHDDAAESARHAQEIDPDQGSSHLILAGIAVDRSDEPAARAELERAERLSPGTPAGKFLAAKFALRFGTAEEALDAIQQAEAAARAHPLALLTRQAAALRRQLDVDSPDKPETLVNPATLPHRDE